MRNLFFVMLSIIILAVSLTTCAGKPKPLRVVATITEGSLCAISTGCQAVEPGEVGSCYVLFKNCSDVAVMLETVDIETGRRDVQIVQQPAGLPKRIEPDRADGVYWYFVSETVGSVAFDVEPVYSTETQ